MNTKIVYVLTSNPNDIYLEQFYVSGLSLRKHMNDCYMCLIVDSKTAQSFTGFRKTMSEIADNICVVDLSENISNQEKSRLLKTSVRNIIDGDFLFIDCDTVIVKPLDEIDNIDAEIAACIDSHTSFAKNPYRDGCIEHGKILEWPIEKETQYFNSGVIFVKDTPTTREFYKKWNSNWKKGAKKGVKMDQPSFALTNYEFNHLIKRLPDDWNCELKHGITCFKSAKIVHYLCTNVNKPGDEQIFLLHNREIFDEIKKTESLPQSIYNCIDDWTTGLTTPTQIISGIDLQLNQSLSYHLLKKYYHSKLFNLSEAFLKSIMNLKTKLKGK